MTLQYRGGERREIDRGSNKRNPSFGAPLAFQSIEEHFRKVLFGDAAINLRIVNVSH